LPDVPSTLPASDKKLGCPPSPILPDGDTTEKEEAPPPYVEDNNTAQTPPTNSHTSKSNGNDLPDFDELNKRFEALKRKK